ncbi:MAG: hypothetical protein GF411_03400, partial [Candidatus Lokiarchaeota archaeon]|nr:hypothetical protein [Candidatus Lokiarchaeota archaeon]
FTNMTASCPIYNLESYPSGAIFLYGSVAYNIIQNNFIEDTTGPGIWVRESSFNTISENAIASCGEAAIRLSADGDIAVNNTIHGNLFVGNDIGVEILYLGANTTTYENMFLMNNEAATDQGNDNNVWDNSTWGNVWYARYTGSDTDSDWIGQTAFILDTNITDNCPAFRIGDLPPGSGDWTISKPTGFWAYDITIPGDITLDGIASALIVLDLNVSMTQGSTTYLNLPAYSGVYFGGVAMTLSGMFRIDSFGEFNIHNSAFSGSSLRIDMNGGTTEFINSNVTGGGWTYFEGCVDFRVENSVFEAQVSIESGSSQGTFDHCNFSQFTNSVGTNYFTFESCIFDDYLIVGLSDYYTFYQCSFGVGYIEIDRTDYVTFNDCDFSGYREITGHPDMLNVYSSDWFNFIYNTIENTTRGLDFESTNEYGEISYNEFNMISGVAIDFLMAGIGNYYNVTHNTFDGCTTAIQAEGNSAIVTWNEITNCNSIGIDVDGNGGTATIENNVVECSGTYIIWAQYLSGASIANNIITGASNFGLYLNDFNNGLIQNNTITETTQYAIIVPGSSSGSDIYDNYIMHNDGWGLYVEGNLDTVWFNSFWDNDDGNIFIESFGSVTNLDNGTHGNFWGPSPNGYDYYSGPDSATDWIGGGTYDVYLSTTLKAQDNYPLLINNRNYLTYPTTVSGVPLYVAEELIVLGESITLEDGIRVLDGFSLALIGTQVDFDTSTPYAQKIQVETGGTLILFGGTLFTTNDMNTYELELQSGSTFYVNNATMEYIGYGGTHDGLYINVSTVTLLNLVISHSESGLILDGVNGITIENISIYSCNVGIEILNSDDITISHGQLTWTDTATGILISATSNNNIIEYIEFNYFGSCINLTGDNNIIRYCKFWNSHLGIYVAPGVTSSTVYMNMFTNGVDFYIEDAGSGTSYNNGTYGNWYEDYTGEDNDGDLVGDTPYNTPSKSDIEDTMPLVIFGSYPTASGWTITEETVVLHTNYTLSGNLIVNEGQNLIIYGGTIWFDCTVQAEFELGVYGYLEMHDNALCATNLNYMFVFNAYDVGSLYIRNLYLSGTYVFRIRTNSTNVQTILLEDTDQGIHIYGTSSAHLNSITLSDIVVNRSASYGIYALYTDTVNLFSVTVEDMEQGIRTEFVTDATISTFESTDCGYGLYVRETTDLSVSNGVIHASTTGIHIQNPFYGTMTINNVDIVTSGSYGFYMFMSGYYGNSVSLTSVNVTGASMYSFFIQRVGLCTMTECNAIMSDSGSGVYLSFISWAEVENTTISHSSEGLYLRQLSALITGCEFWNVTNGIYTEYSSTGFNITIENSEFQSCNRGVYPIDFSNNKLNVTNNQFWYGSRAVYQVETDYFEFAYNEVWYQDYGIFATAGIDYLIHHNVYHSVESPIVMNSGGTGGSISFETINDAVTAIQIQFVDDFIISNCSISYADYAVDLTSCTNITLYGIEIEVMNLSGVYIASTEGVNMTYCSIGGCMYAISYSVTSEAEANHNIDTTNLYEGKPIYYFFNETGLQHSYLNTSHLTMFYCDDVVIVNSTVDTDGLYLGFCTGCNLVNSSLGRAIQLNSVEDILFIGNEFPIFGTTIAKYNFATNVTFTRNAFLNLYTFSQTGYNLNGSDHLGNYWHDYSGEDANYDGIGDTPHVTNTMNDYHPLVVAPRSVLVRIEILSPADESVVTDTALIRANVTLIPGIYYGGAGSTVTTVQTDTTVHAGGSIGVIEVEVTLSEGENHIFVNSTVDASSEFYTMITLTSDLTNPVIDLDIEDGYATTLSNPQIGSTLTDNNSLAWAVVVVNGSIQNNDTLSTSSVAWTFDITFSSDGLYIVSYLVADEVGNVANLTITMYRDTADPVVVDPADVSYQDGTTGNIVTIEANDLTPFQYNVSLDGFLIDTVEWDGTDVVIDVDGLSVGEHELEVIFQDRVGHDSMVSVTITVIGPITPPTSSTTTTTTTTTTTSSPPPTELDPMIVLLVVGGLGGAIIVIVVIFVLRKRAAT